MVGYNISSFKVPFKGLFFFDPCFKLIKGSHP